MEKLEFEFKGEKYTRHFKSAKEKENYIINIAKEVIFSDGLLEVIKNYKQRRLPHKYCISKYSFIFILSAFGLKPRNLKDFRVSRYDFYHLRSNAKWNDIKHYEKVLHIVKYRIVNEDNEVVKGLNYPSEEVAEFLINKANTGEVKIYYKDKIFKFEINQINK